MWSSQEAFLGVLSLMAVHDGHLAAKRLRAVHEFAQRSPFLAPLGEKGVTQLHADICVRIADAHGDALAQACGALPPEMRPSMYAACADVLSAGGAFSLADEKAMRALRSALQIAPAQAQQLEAAMLLKNKY